MNSFDTQQNHPRRLGLIAGLLLASLLLLALALVPLAAARDLPRVHQAAAQPAAIPVTPTVDLTPYAGNPIVTGQPGTWAAQIWKTQAVVTDGVTYLFFSSAVDWWYSPLNIGLVTSTDGISFSDHSPTPLIEPDASGFDAQWVNAGPVIWDHGQWLMYYGGNYTYTVGDGTATGRAVADHLTGPWHLDEDPVLEPGSTGEWDDAFVVAESVISTGLEYRMYYFGSNTGANWRVGLATSTNGITWTKYNDPSTVDPPYAESDPVLMPKPGSSWESSDVYGTQVFSTPYGWEMFYTGINAAGGDAIGYALSQDGIHWSRPFDAPVIHPDDDPWANNRVAMPAALRSGEAYTLYYDYREHNRGIGLAQGTVEWPILVDTADDELNTDGDCSLREAIQAANTDAAVDACPAGSGHDTVIVPAGTYTLTLHGAQEDANLTGDLDILDHLTLQGDGADLTIIDGDADDRIFHVHNGVTADFSNLTLRNGDPPAVGGHGGGAILNDAGEVMIRNAIIRDNRARNAGGLYNVADDNGSATMVVSNCQILNNTADGTLSGAGAGGGIYNLAIDNNSTAALTVTHSLFAGNHADDDSIGGGGGAVGSVVAGCSVCAVQTTIRDSTLRDNSARRGGAVIHLRYQTTGSPQALLVLDRCTVSGNTAATADGSDGDGGGLWLGPGEAHILNSTISGNTAYGSDGSDGEGGGLYTRGEWMEGTTLVSIENTTISSNTATSLGAALVSAADPGTTPPETNFHNTIVADNASPSFSNCYLYTGTLTSGGYNLEDADSCQFDQPTDLVNTDPLLGPLQDNGGDTWTQALLYGSPAIDAGDPLTYPPTDQRGLPRPFDGDGDTLAVSDIGAFEAQEDLIPPAVLATSPVSGALHVDLSAPVMITFSEPISAGSLAYAIDPDPYEWGETWNGANSAVTLTHADFEMATTYTFSVTAAADLSGYPLADAPVVWTFSTGQHQLYLPLILRQ